MTLIPIHEAKTRLTELVRQAEEGQLVVITRNGRPVVSIESLAASRSQSISHFKKPLVPKIESLPILKSKTMVKSFLLERE